MKPRNYGLIWVLCMLFACVGFFGVAKRLQSYWLWGDAEFREGLTRQDQKFAQRKARVIRACSRLVKEGQHPRPSIDMDIAFYLLRYNAFYCAIFKCATSSLAKYFSKLSDRQYYDRWLQNLDHHITQARNMYMDVQSVDFFARAIGKTPEQILANSHPKIVFVRNPVDRLLSGWNDKLKNPSLTDLPAFWIGQAKQIRRRIGKTDDTSGVSLLEFFQYLNGEDPKNWERHFQPQYRQADPCAIDYDFIGMVENLREDAEYVAKQLTKAQPEKFVEMDIGVHIGNYTEGRYDLLRTIPRSLVESVLNGFYRLDYEIFPYDLDSDLEKIYGVKFYKKTDS